MQQVMSNMIDFLPFQWNFNMFLFESTDILSSEDSF